MDKDKFEHPTVYISDFYKQLSKKFNGKYSPKELEFICENEKQLICSLLKENDIVETKSNVYVKKYDNHHNPIGVSVSPPVVGSSVSSVFPILLLQLSDLQLPEFLPV